MISDLFIESPIGILFLLLILRLAVRLAKFYAQKFT